MSLPVLPSPRLPKDQILAILERISGVQVVWSTASQGLLGQRANTEHAWLSVSLVESHEVGLPYRLTQLNPPDV